MPRAPGEKKAEAEKLFKKGMKLTDIAKKLDVPEGTVRSWKNRGKWASESPKNGKRNVANEEADSNATLQKKKRGGQPGNKNSKGASKGKGNRDPVTPPDVTKHGGYRPVFMDALDEDEQELLENVPQEEEKLLMEQIQLFSIRERRILKAINKYREQKGEVTVADVTRFEEKRTFKDKDEEAEYNRRQQEKVDKEERLPGKSYSIQTHTTNKDLIVARLEQELSSVQNKKTKAIEALSKIKLERARIKSESAGNDAVDDWISAILGEEDEDSE